MIASLDDAWNWYQCVRLLTRSMQGLGEKYWTALPWEGALGRDNHLRDLEATTVLEASDAVLGDLDDLGVLLLFSVFESIFRERARADVAAELPELKHPVLLHAVKNLNESIESGSFFRVLEAYKGLDSGLEEEVNQVRRYRNWVAHGRRGERPGAVEPRAAYLRLKRLLEVIAAAPPAEGSGSWSP